MILSAILALLISVFLTSCALLQNGQSFPSTVWNVNERAGFGSSTETFAYSQTERFVRVPLNPDKKSDGYFDLYYFMQTPSSGQPEIKTVLFCGGGPGELVELGGESLAKFWKRDASAYNIVYFHLRGAGFSQLPPSNKYDEFLRTKFAVEDIEKIRKQVLGDRPWDGIIGYSYGTVLAQQYAGKYSQRVRKLILMAPLSMHKFKGSSSMAAYDDYSTAVRRIREEILDNIFVNNVEFNQLIDGEKEGIKSALVKVFETIESNFGNEEFIFDRYCRLKNTGMLDKYGLQGYSRLFFQKLRELRNIGWKPYRVPGHDLRANQVEAVQVISVSLIPKLREKLGLPKPDDECAVDGQADRAYRTLYGVRTYDGGHRRFLKEWLAEGKSNIRTALRRSAGVAHVQNGVNESIEKVGIANDEPIKVWDPAEYQHNVPTLIVEGGADPVTADGQAEYYFKQALIGPRTLINLPGVGHDLSLPSVIIDQPFIVGSVRLDPGKIAAGGEVRVTNTISSSPPHIKNQSVIETPVDCLEAIFFPRSDVVFVRVNNSTPSEEKAKCEIDYEHRLFTVTVSVDSLKVPRGQSWVSGSVKKVIPNFRLEKPGNLEPGLEFASSMDHWDELTVRIKNVTGQPLETKAKEWILITAKEKTGKVDSPCQGFDIPPLLPAHSCVIYTFLEMEHEDFKSANNEIVRQLLDRQLAGPPQHCSGIGC